jgi:hypothetical protein
VLISSDSYARSGIVGGIGQCGGIFVFDYVGGAWSQDVPGASNEGGVFIFDLAAPLCHPGFGDADADGDVDLADWAIFTECLHGPATPPAPAAPLTAGQCLASFDVDADADVDLEDAAMVQGRFGN